MDYSELSEPLFHGSDESFSTVDLSKSAPNKDFGRGFYTTNNKSQAEKFARLKARRSQFPIGYVEEYRLTDTENLRIKLFPLADEEWFDYILENRGYGNLTALDSEKTFDIVIGPVANDAVGTVLNQFVAGVFGDPETIEAKETAIRLLLAQKLHNQVYFGTEQAVSRLEFVGVYNVRVD